jgi:uncharacterized protein (DUF486 family)
MERYGVLVLLFFSNIFMTYAWYGHLKDFRKSSLVVVILLSWGVAFFEYCLQVPANRIGHGYYTVAQLKVIQEVITMVVFGLFSVFYLGEQWKTDYLWSALCLVAAAYFMFRGVAVN